MVLKEIYKVDWQVSFFFLFFFYKFVLETWMSRRVSFFIGILSEAGDKFLQNYSQVCPYL